MSGTAPSTTYATRKYSTPSLGRWLVFYNCIVGGVIDQRFILSIQKGIMEKDARRSVTGSYAATSA